MKQKRLWVFDFDGTLSEIVPAHHSAMLDPNCRDMLIVLVEKFGGAVAVISSRSLYDLSTRIEVPGLFLGSSCGFVWQLPGGDKKFFSEHFVGHLEKQRAVVLPKIKELELLYGIETEDKTWSMTLHLQNMPPEQKQRILAMAGIWQTLHAIQIFHGPEALEIHFLPEINKLIGVQHFCKLLGLNPALTHITYAGDDENDISVMNWVLHHNGIVYSVGNTALVPGSLVVKNPSLLAREIQRQLEKPETTAAQAAH